MIHRSLLKNLLAGARLAFFLPLRAFDFRAGALDYAALVAFNCFLWVVVAALRTGFDGEFDSAALLNYLASVPLVLATALVVAHVFAMPERCYNTSCRARRDWPLCVVRCYDTS